MNEHLLKSKRLDVVDALRGFASLAIILIHNLQLSMQAMGFLFGRQPERRLVS